jgi:hypothetical protein
VPTFNTGGLSTAVTAVLTALAAKPAARDTDAPQHLARLIDAMRGLGL